MLLMPIRAAVAAISSTPRRPSSRTRIASVTGITS
jgi:hypothetical protein